MSRLTGNPIPKTLRISVSSHPFKVLQAWLGKTYLAVMPDFQATWEREVYPYICLYLKVPPERQAQLVWTHGQARLMGKCEQIRMGLFASLPLAQKLAQAEQRLFLT